MERDSSKKAAPEGWHLLHVIPEGQILMINGIDVWAHEWQDTREKIHVKDPVYQQDFVCRVYEIVMPDRIVTFAATEFSNAVWAFYVKSPATPQ